MTQEDKDAITLYRRQHENDTPADLQAELDYINSRIVSDLAKQAAIMILMANRK